MYKMNSLFYNICMKGYKSMKKVFLFIILVAMCVTLFSCAKETSEELQKDNSENKNEAKIDLNGYKASIIRSDDENRYLMYIADSAFADSARKKVAEIEELLNCKIEIILSPKDTLGADVYAAVSAGMDPAEIMIADDGQYGNLGKSGLLTPMDDVRHIIDYMDSAKFGTIGALESIMYNGIVYGVYPNYWPECFPGFYAPIVFNGDIMKAAVDADPREFVEQRTWTREKFAEVLEACTFNDGVKDIRALAVEPSHFINMALAANHVNLTTKIDNEYTLEYKSQRGIDALDWARTLKVDKKHCFSLPQTKLDWWEQYRQSFYEGKAAMLMYPTWGIYGVSDTTVGYHIDNFGILPIPTGPFVEYGDWAGYIEGVGHIMTIPITASEVEYAAHVINAMCDPLENFETEEKRLEYYSKHLFHDLRDYELFFKMVENSRYNYWKDDGKSMINNFTGTSSKTTSEIIGMYEERFYNSVLSKFVIPNQQFIDSLN